MKNDLPFYNLNVEDATELALDRPLWRLLLAIIVATQWNGASWTMTMMIQSFIDHSLFITLTSQHWLQWNYQLSSPGMMFWTKFGSGDGLSKSSVFVTCQRPSRVSSTSVASPDSRSISDTSLQHTHNYKPTLGSLECCNFCNFGSETDPTLVLFLFFLLGQHFAQKPKAPPFWIGSRWNLARMLFK